MNLTGFWLTLITVLLCSGTIIIHPYVKKVTTKYWFWCVIGILFLSYLIACRFYWNFSDFWSSDSKTGIIASRGLLLDLCPFCAFVLPLSLIIDPTRKSASAIAYLAITGGLITFFGGFCVSADDESTNASWKLWWIFKGDSLNRMYFMMHFIQVFLGVWVLVSSKRKPFLDLLFSTCLILGYFLWVIIIVYAFKNTFQVYSNATGLIEGDWEEWGEYGAVSNFINLPFPWVAIVSYLLCGIMVGILITLYWLLQKNKKYSFANNYIGK